MSSGRAAREMSYSGDFVVRRGEVGKLSEKLTA
jgi:hypothetical protein